MPRNSRPEIYKKLDVKLGKSMEKDRELVSSLVVLLFIAWYHPEHGK